MGWKLLHRHDTSPGNAAGEFGPVRSEQALADFRVDAIGADHERCFHAFARLEPDLSLFVGLCYCDAPLAKLIASAFRPRIASARMPCRSLRCSLMWRVPSRSTKFSSRSN